MNNIPKYTSVFRKLIDEYYLRKGHIVLCKTKNRMCVIEIIEDWDDDNMDIVGYVIKPIRIMNNLQIYDSTIRIKDNTIDIQDYINNSEIYFLTQEITLFYISTLF